jgi:hypothetical protein
MKNKNTFKIILLNNIVWVFVTVILSQYFYYYGIMKSEVKIESVRLVDADTLINLDTLKLKHK